jgi:DNA-binding MarR family transcriptional regulator
MQKYGQFVVWQRATQIVGRRLHDLYKPYGYDVKHLWVLMCVREGTNNQGACADKLGINRNMMVQIVDGMEHHGLARRVRNLDNRKEVLLHITAKGQKALEWVDAIFDDITVAAYRPLTIEEVAEITVKLKRIVLGARGIGD